MKGMGDRLPLGSSSSKAGGAYGGTAFPKGLGRAHHTASQLGYDFKLLRSVVGDQQGARPRTCVEMMRKAMGPPEDKTIAVLGLALSRPTPTTCARTRASRWCGGVHARGVGISVRDTIRMAIGERAGPSCGGRGLLRVGIRGRAAGARRVTLLTEWNRCSSA